MSDASPSPLATTTGAAAPSSSRSSMTRRPTGRRKRRRSRRCAQCSSSTSRRTLVESHGSPRLGASTSLPARAIPERTIRAAPAINHPLCGQRTPRRPQQCAASERMRVAQVARIERWAAAVRHTRPRRLRYLPLRRGRRRRAHRVHVDRIPRRREHRCGACRRRQKEEPTPPVLDAPRVRDRARRLAPLEGQGEE